MKRKAIKNIPYLAGQGRGEGQFTLAVDVKMIEGEEHLFLEAYDEGEIPKARAVYTRSDWEIYYPADDTWSSGGIRDIYGRMPWEVGHMGSSTEVSDADGETIMRFCGKEHGKWTKWYRAVEYLQNNIRCERREKRETNDRLALEERNRNVPDLPEGFENWYKNTLMNGMSFIYYKKKGRFATFTCSHCGMTWTDAVKRKQGYEGQFEHIVPVPKENKRGTCQCCGQAGIYKCAGKMKRTYVIEKKCYIGQRFREKGAVIRYFTVGKNMALGRPEWYNVTEIARNYFEEGKKRIQKDYHVIDNWNGKETWIRQNLGGHYNIVQEAAAVYPGTYRELKGTILQYSGIKEYMRIPKEVKLGKYMETYLKHPCLEMLSKTGLLGIADYAMEYKNNMLDESAEKPEDILGIYKGRIKLLSRYRGDTTLWKLLRMEREEGYNWKESECEILRRLDLDRKNLKTALEYMSARQLLNRIEKYAGCSIGEGCSRAAGRLRHVTIMYLDYLDMRKQSGYDLNNTIYAYPRDIEAAHGKMILEINAAELETRIAEKEKEFPHIRKMYRHLRDYYFREFDGMAIRPAKSAAEIIVEGKTLHHCVGGDNYLRKHDDGKSVILFLRFKEEPDTPYITVEMQGDRVLQWYGAYDRKPDRENMQKWLDAYAEGLKSLHITEKVQAAG